MNYLLKNAKGMGLLIFLLGVMVAVNYTLEQKEQKVQQAFELMVPTMLHKIKTQCDVNGGFRINGQKYTCIPSDAI